MPSVFRKSLALAALLIFAAACSDPTSVDTPGNGPGTPGGNQQPGPGPEPCTPRPLPWLVQGNFWRVAWTWVEIDVGWTSSYGDYDAGSYTIALGPSSVVDGKTMFDLQVSGDVDEYGPIWTRIGTDGCGNVYGQTSSVSAPELVYSETSNQWSGTGFWTDFEPFDEITVRRNASMTPSQFTKQLPHFAPPLTAVGYEDSSSSWDPGGCEYFAGYGTICTEGSAGPVSGTQFHEYWDADVGPVGMHYGSDYEDCIGTACDEKHVEHRVEVWFFGDATELPIIFEHEPDTYADPTPFPVSEELLVMFAAVSDFDTPSGYIPGYDAGAAMALAASVHDWFSFEITPELAGLDVDFYLAWNDDVDLGFYLFTDPRNETYGFQHLAEATSFSFQDFEHASFLSGTYLPGEYLLGVRRESAADVETGYGIFSIGGKGDAPEEPEEPEPDAPEIAVSVTQRHFTATEGGADPASRGAQIGNAGGGTLTGLQVSVSPPASWLSVTLSSTTAPASLTFTASVAGLAPGTYGTTVAISSSVATNSPQLVSVSLTVEPAPSAPATPTQLRIINDLPGNVVGPNDWGELNTVIRVRVGPSQQEVVDNNGQAQELLHPADVTSSLANTIDIPPGAETTLDVSSQNGPYWIYVQTGWWEYFFESGLWEKHPAVVVSCDGFSSAYKWTTIQIVEPFFHPEEIRLSDWLPIGNWYGSPFCG